MLADVVTNRPRCDGHHVLAGGIASGEFEQKIDVVALDRYSNVRQFTVCGGLGGSRSQFFAMLDAPDREQPRTYEAMKGESGCAAHTFIQHHAHAPTRLGNDLRSPRIGSYKSSLSGRHRYVIIASGEDASYAQWTCDSNRNPNGPEAVLDVILIQRNLGFSAIGEKRAPGLCRMRSQIQSFVKRHNRY